MLELNQPKLMEYRGEQVMIRFVKPTTQNDWFRVRFSKAKKVDDKMMFDEWKEQLMTQEFFEDQFKEIIK